MKKIIKKVDLPRIKKCSYCKSVFSYTMKDVDDIFNKLSCPVCNHYMYPSIFDKKLLNHNVAEEPHFSAVNKYKSDLDHIYIKLNEIQLLLKNTYSKKKIRRKVIYTMGLIVKYKGECDTYGLLEGKGE